MSIPTELVIRERGIEPVQPIPLDRAGTTDECGFSPCCDDASTARDMAFENIRARVEGTRLASERLGTTR
jgi:5-methyltetrahydropteroyltriglutamate--homocysteine methyltransferase